MQRSVKKQSFSDGVSRVWNHLKAHKWVFCSSFVVGLLSYAFAFLNKLPISDDVQFFYSKGYALSSGRFLLPLTSALFPNVSMPWIYGILSLFLLSLSILVLVCWFQIPTGFSEGLFAALVTAFPCVIGTFCYMFTAPSYFLALLFTVLGARALCRPNLREKLCGVLLLVLSMGIYQAYLSVAVSLLCLWYLRRAVCEEEKLSRLMTDGVFAVALLFLAAVLYWGIAKAAMSLASSGMNEYAAEALAGGNLFRKLYEMYYLLFTVLFRLDFGIIQKPAAIFHYLLLAFSVSVFVWRWARLKGVGRKLLVVFLAACFPLSLNCIWIVLSGGLHTLTMMSYLTLYLLVFLAMEFLAQEEGRRAAVFRALRGVCAVLAVCIVAVNVYAANAAYTQMHLAASRATAFYTTLSTRIQMHPEFEEGVKVAIVGENPRAVTREGILGELTRITGTQGFLVGELEEEAYLYRLVGFDVPYATKEERRALRETEAFSKMSFYPYEGSVSRIGDFLVVKYSD